MTAHDDGTLPFAEVEQIGRWTYRVRVRDGISCWAPDGMSGWRVFGRQRAHRKASKVLRRYLTMQHRKANVERVLLDGR